MPIIVWALAYLGTLSYSLNNSDSDRIVNILLFLGFLGITGLLLYYRYKGKLNPEEIKAKENIKKQYLFEKLHKISYEKRKENQNLITDLPII